jgi:aspartyl protease family protein
MLLAGVLVGGSFFFFCGVLVAHCEMVIRRNRAVWKKRIKDAVGRPLPIVLFIGLGIVVYLYFFGLAETRQPAPSKPVLHTAEVEIARDNSGASYVMASVNGAEIPFMVDSGASDVCLPNDVINGLRRSGRLTDADWTGWQNATFADGRTVRSRTFNLRRLTIGPWTLNDVAGSSCGKGNMALLGQAVLGRFTSWSLDNQRNVLLLAGWKHN